MSRLLLSGMPQAAAQTRPLAVAILVVGITAIAVGFAATRSSQSPAEPTVGAQEVNADEAQRSTAQDTALHVQNAQKQLLKAQSELRRALRTASLLEGVLDAKYQAVEKRRALLILRAHSESLAAVEQAAEELQTMSHGREDLR